MRPHPDAQSLSVCTVNGGKALGSLQALALILALALALVFMPNPNPSPIPTPDPDPDPDPNPNAGGVWSDQPTLG